MEKVKTKYELDKIRHEEESKDKKLGKWEETRKKYCEGEKNEKKK